jgi:hypothetical protein
MPLLEQHLTAKFEGQSPNEDKLKSQGWYDQGSANFHYGLPPYSLCSRVVHCLFRHPRVSTGKPPRLGRFLDTWQRLMLIFDIQNGAWGI